ncbi:MAG: ABC transporter ATP-binding protein [Bacillota bacterium]|nr:ABC transporter ATP-binding protein [Bacillota bacterium]
MMGVLRRLGPFLRPYRGRLAGGILMILVVPVLAALSPWVLMWVVDSILQQGRWGLLPWGALALVAVAAMQGISRFLQRYSMQYVAQRVTYDLRNRLFGHLQQLSFGFYDQAQTGQIMSRLTIDVETVNRFMAMGIMGMGNSLLQVLITVAVLLRLNWRLTLVSMVVLPPLVHAVVEFGRRVRPLWRQIHQQMAVLTAYLQESLAGIRVVQSFAREDLERAKFTVQNRLYMDMTMKALRGAAFWGPYMNFLGAAGTALVLGYGGREVMLGRLTVGGLVAFTSYLGQLMMPIRQLGFLVNLTSRGTAAAGRLFELLDTPAEVQEKPGAVAMPPFRGQVRFEKVSFRYRSGFRALENIDLEVLPGQTVVILGPTGSGKSSLIHLIPRFYDVEQGQVLIDGVDVRDMTLDSLRRQVGVVTQETFLFSASIRENIAYGRPEATLEEVARAAQAAHIHDFIASLPQGYDTVIGERGVGLSGGQKQRVAIARALLMDARILLFDESTSSVDAETEYRIQQEFVRLLRDRTSFIIAQRLSTVRTADLIVVLDQGRIVGRGTHEELVRSSALYRKIYETQLGGTREEAGHVVRTS